jgi:deazaflavin-dependent oxidoreductase (nitroreductase family)
MPLSGEYEPSPWDWVRQHADEITESGSTEGVEMKGKPLILLTTRGAKTGKIRKTPLMRVEHGGQYAIVASLGGAPKNPVWYHNVKAHPRVELQDGAVTREFEAREVTGDQRHSGGSAPSRPGPTMPSIRRKRTARSRCSC